MKFSDYLNNRENDIIKLKEELMEKETASTTISTKTNKDISLSDEVKKCISDEVKKCVSDEVKKCVSEEVKKCMSDEIQKCVSEEVNKKFSTILGEIFEENIRGGLKFKYNFEESSFKRKLIYRKIKTPSEVIILTEDDEKTIKINGKKFIFILNKDHSITFKDCKKDVDENVENNKDEIDRTINGEKIIFLPGKEIEADGIFEIEDFNSSMIDSNEATIIYSNIKEGQKDFNMAILETKLNKAKISELAHQIQKDNNFFGKKLKKKIVYLEFINSPTIDSNSIKNFARLKKISCVIYGIKESKFAGKNVLRPIDWDLLIDIKGMKEDIKLLLDKFEKIEKKFHL